MLGYIRKKIKEKIKGFIIKIIRDELEKQGDTYFQIFTQMNEFRNASEDMLSSKVEAETNISDLVKRFEKLKITVKKIEIDIKDFEKWSKEYFEIMNFYKSSEDVRIEKTLEHYLTMKYLPLNPEDIYIDVAALESPFADIVRKHLKNKTYKQDLVYEAGIHGNKIGGDAGRMPVSANFADVMTLHCAYECFQGDSDIRFIKEASRVMRDGGRLGIVPLYIDNVYFVKTGPKYDKRKVKVEKEARWVWRDDKWDKEPFSRHYSPESFKARIIDNIDGLDFEILHFSNLKEIEDYHRGQKIYCHFMFKAVKK